MVKVTGHFWSLGWRMTRVTKTLGWHGWRPTLAGKTLQGPEMRKAFPRLVSVE